MKRAIKAFTNHISFGEGWMLVSGLIVAGLAVIGVGLLLIVVGVVMLMRAVSGLGTRLRVYAAEAETGKGPIADMTELVKGLKELIELVGVARGVPLAVMILGVLLVVVGAGIITASA